MSFVSWTFPAFLAASLGLYYVMPKRFRWVVLLAASCLFYLAGGAGTAGYLLFATVTTWAAGLALAALTRREKALPKSEGKKLLRGKKAVAAAALVLNFGMLFLVKYLDFALQTVNRFLAGLGLSTVPGRVELLLPLGISFFVFQSAGYVIDLFRGKYEPQKNLLKYALFTSFFPQVVQGPISRYDELAPQLLAPHDPRAENLRDGIQLMLWGYIKKMVIADRAAVAVNTFFANYDGYGGAIAAFSVLMYCIELYCDFSGGIDIARGAAQCFGIDLAENFRRPLFATSLAEFWRRWHITLGTWMRDYVFYPLSLSRPFGRLGKWSRRHIRGKLGKIVSTSLATFIVYLLIGIWHGANFRYIAFGFWNGAIITASMLLAGCFSAVRAKLRIRQDSAPWRIFCMLRTAFIVFLGRFITRSPRLIVAGQLAAKMFSRANIDLHQLWDGSVMTLGLAASDLWVIGLCTMGMLLVEWFEETRGSVREALAKRGALVQWIAIAAPMAVLLLLGIMRGSYISSEFIYRQF